MNNILAYSGLTTKIRAMTSYLITTAEYEQIVNLTSVAEVVGFLQSHPGYSNIFEGLESSELHRSAIERLLFFSEYKSFAKLYNFSSMKGRRYLELYFIKYEAHLLKHTIREILDNQTVTIDIASLSPYFDRFSDINLKALSTVTSLEGFFEALKNTKYYQPLKNIQSMENTTLFDYEICLDLYFFTTIWKGKDKYLTGKDLDVITSIYGTTIDLLNLQWIYRVKKYYNVSNADIYTLIIPINYKLKKSQLKAFAEADSIASLADMLRTTYYSSYASYGNEISLESLYKLILDKLHKSNVRYNPYSLAAVDNFLYFKHEEITRLTTLTECIRYSYSPLEIIKILE